MWRLTSGDRNVKASPYLKYGDELPRAGRYVLADIMEELELDARGRVLARAVRTLR